MNENIGGLGQAFIAQQTKVGIDFDQAWAEWSRISTALRFILVECPEVRNYDDPRITDRAERLRIRRLAQKQIGRHIRSSHVSELGQAARGLGARKPGPRYRMDRQLVRENLSKWWDHSELNTSTSFDWLVEAYAKDMEKFAMENSFWALSPRRLIQLYPAFRRRYFECYVEESGSMSSQTGLGTTANRP